MLKLRKKKIMNDTIVSEFENKEESEYEEDENNKKGIKKSELINPDENDEQMAFELNPFSMVLKEDKKEEENNEETKNNKKSKKSEEESYKINKIKFKNAAELHKLLQDNLKENPDQQNNSSTK